MPKKIRTRIAPSPTGNLHLGTARAALFNYLFAKQQGGAFILRIEDTDLKRSAKKFEQNIIDGFLWLGILWDEGPDPQKPEKYIGNLGPYRQTQRNYQPHIEKLLKEKKAFWCWHSKEELETEKQLQLKNKEPQRHLCAHFIDGQPQGNKEPGIIRLKNNGGQIKFGDLIRGKIEFDTSLLGDISIARDKQTPLYNLAVVIDDAEMEISHVIRGEDHISNTPKQILIYQALGLDIPKFAHLPLLLGPDRAKLSKRHGATSITEFRDQGYLPEALVNFMALLGWNPGDQREIFSLEQLTSEFSLAQVHKGGAVVNLDKLKSINSFYLKQKSPEDLRQEAGIPKNIPLKAVRLAQERATTLAETASLATAIIKESDYEQKLLLWKESTAPEIKKNLKVAYQILNALSEQSFATEELKAVLLPAAEKTGDRGAFLWPLRVALSGKKQSPPPFDLAEIWGKQKSLKKIKQAIDKLK
ncbi:MAG: glutamate--tRNA ligase [Candidatus Portnoybacteria bacterium CG10_big_fil_rev_8_21_14_0_10_44_7]|uniref:Glutamate--tRNA ligase n=1 Tax=Candidatus Portnoybacteria bacterium CG10_big_fil_rev_8_21_14_0_10_44_7 TaxID=1974816 RepID=A0A2M8KIM2_9BACT|nr:MAG: glutamate--tRNA ligase [Candidatus Portnoybacteria bacterium CG10_big_fil_rev_8_21_14_0_10_44_7]